MKKNIKKICVNSNSSFMEVLSKQEGDPEKQSSGGIVLVVDKNGCLCGTITAGDARRAYLNNSSGSIQAKDMMRRNPICFSEDLSYGEILDRLPKELEDRGRKSRKFLEKIIIVDSELKPVRLLEYHELWEQRVATHRHIVIVGLGYVGLTLALVMADEGLLVTGVEVNEKRRQALKRGDPYVHEPGMTELLSEQIDSHFRINGEIPEDGDVYIISVGTPVRSEDEGRPVPVIDELISAAEKIGARLRQGNLVVLRSTVPVGITRSVVLPVLERTSKLRCGYDFHLAFAPERTAEGKALQELRELPQLIGGYNKDSAEATAALFRELTNTIVRVDSLESAEMAKLINNTYRDLVFSYANYVSQLAASFNIDIVEIINAANRGYPRDKVPLPSPGVGGPCLTKDPYIFAETADQLGHSDSLFAYGRRVNESMHKHVVEAVLAQLVKLGKDVKSCSILVCGLAFKGDPETGDIRNSSSVEILKLLRDHVGSISGHDPVAGEASIRGEGINPESLPDGFTGKDVVLFLNNHRFYRNVDIFKMTRSMNERPIIYDGWNLFRGSEILKVAPSVYMGLSFVKSSFKS